MAPEFINNIFEFLFGWAVAISPLVGIIFISFVLSLISTLSWKYLTNQILLKSLRERSKAMSSEIKKYKMDPVKLKESQGKFAKENIDIMKTQYKQSLKPMLVTLVPFALAFVWIRKVYEPFGDVFLGIGGIWTYLIFSIIFSIVLRKLLKVY
ncbi:MAG TPA: EMC3/TMCO1 family protein [Candidatus Nanoarchaeia archaeon]|nr:EMC3/TMCO1 family protein [Candidatus Nanoarchaeia archaeon]